MHIRVPAAFVVIAALTLMACGGDDQTITPTGPTTTEPPTPVSLEIQGPTSLEVDQEVQYRADITMSDGAMRQGLTAGWHSEDTTVATVDDSGRVTGHQPGMFDLRAEAEGLTATRTGIRVDPKPGPRTSFGAGTWLVNDDIAPGRYFTDPSSACYWERLSGVGGTLDDVIANEFIGFDSGQEIVHIDGSDHAFATDADCGTWNRSPRTGPPSGRITPGRWLVGRQLQAGEHTTMSEAGCYWERLRGFSGELRHIIANDFVGDAGQQVVSISGSDAGFYSDDSCGTWTRRGGSANVAPSGNLLTIESNRRRYRGRSR